MTTHYDINVEKRRNIFGKLTGEYKATITPVNGSPAREAEGATAKEAKENLINDLGEMALQAFNRKYIFTNSGTILVLYYNGNWCYDIIDSGRSYPSSCIMQTDYRDSLKAALDHAAQSFEGVLKVVG